MKSNKKEEKYWESLHNCMESIKYDSRQIIFTDLFEKYLKKGGSCFEVGCYPGNFLIYFSKELGCDVSGIDMAPRLLERTPAYLRANGVSNCEIIYQDFMEYKPSKLYDIVCSFGFVEHFVNYEEIIVKHISMVKPGGKLVITTPNLRGLQYIFHLLIDRRALPFHVIPSMNLRKWRKILKANNMRIIYHNYYRTAGFVSGPDDPKFRYQRILLKAYNKLCASVESRIAYPNAFFSPYQISISEKLNLDDKIRQQR